MPNFVARLSGIPANLSQALGSKELARLTVEYAENDARLSETIERASAELHEKVGSEQDPRARAQLLKLRRSIFNKRLPAGNQYFKDQHFDGDTRYALDLLVQRTRLELQIERHYETCLTESRLRLKEFLQEPNLHDGLVLSSPSLSRNIARYRNTNGSLNGRDLQIERGLLRYTCRAAMKATPFASFCYVIPGRFVDNVGFDSTFKLLGSLKRRESVVRANKALYGTLWSGIKADRDLRRHLSLELNSTIQETSNSVRFYAGVGTREMFQKVSSNEALSIVMLRLRNEHNASYQSLCNALVADEEIDTTDEEASQFVDGLLNLGLLRFVSPIPAQEADWLLPLSDFLRPIPLPVAQKLSDKLIAIHECIDAYQSAGSTERPAILEKLARNYSSVTEAVGGAPWHKNALALYEDCTANAELLVGRSPAVQKCMTSLEGLAATLLPTAYPRLEMMTMRHFFDARYSSTSKSQTPLLEFFEIYLKEYFVDHLRHETSARRGEKQRNYRLENPFQLKSVDNLLSHTAKWTDRITRAWAAEPNAVEINITAELGATDERPRNQSASLFGQLVVTGSQTRFINESGQLFLGFGKYFSRFLSLFPPEVCSDLLAINERRHSSPVLAEISADGNFNANFHPPLTPSVIAYPIGDSSRAPSQIEINHLMVERDPDNVNALRLVHRDTKEAIRPLDLGFQNPQLRPALYRFLTLFAPVGGARIRLPQALPGAHNADSPKVDSIVYRPRIVYDNAVVLSRRRWSIPGALFPFACKDETNSAYFVRVNAWRVSNQIPPIGYIRIVPLPPIPPNGVAVEQPEPVGEPNESNGTEDGPEGDDESANDGNALDRAAKPTEQSNPAPQNAGDRRSRDFLKPQFIDFSSPLLVDLFRKLPASLERFVAHIEEQYPSVEQLPCDNGQPHALEMIVQVDWQPVGIDK